MSKTVDQKVVEMRFDNRHFESNVQTSLSTLDKLKAKLKFTDSVKGLDNLSSSVKKVDMNPLGAGVETVRSKFSALEVMGITALANITNSAVNAGKRVAAAFTIEPIKTGFNEYELKMNSVQTIMASTGESLETVNGYLAELNEYSDKTIYSFSDMTQNIGKFTNAGVKLEDAVMAIKGISNEAAVSGANANEASRAMYNFAQALSAGYVKLIDWKSIENANMATVEFKNQLIESAVAAGTLEKQADGMYKVLTQNIQGGTMEQAIDATHNFNDSLNYQWMTTEVLVGTLKKYADGTTEIGRKAFASAQDVKTFSMMMDTLKEAAQSGWAQTWELIIGDFEEAKSFWTELSNFFGGIIEGSSKVRNEFLGGALNSKWDNLIGKINEAGVSTSDFENAIIEAARSSGVEIDGMIKKYGSIEASLAEIPWMTSDIVNKAFDSLTGGMESTSAATEDMTAKLEKFQKIFDETWAGKHGNGVDRVKAFAEAGYDYSKVQSLINEHAAGYKLTLEDLSEEQLEAIGFTKEQTEAFMKLKEEAKDTNTPLRELINSLNKPSGRELLIDSLRNSLKAVSKILGTVKKAWKAVFNPASSDVLYDLIAKFNKFTKELIISDTTAGKLQIVFEGLFKVLKFVKDIVVKVVSVGGRLLWSVFKPLAKAVLSAAAALSEFIMFGADAIKKVFEPIGTVASKAIDTMKKSFSDLTKNIRENISKWIEEFKETELFQKCAEKFGEASEAISKAIDEIKTAIKDFDFGVFGEHLSSAGDFIKDLAVKLGNNKYVVGAIDGIANAFGSFLGLFKNIKLPTLDGVINFMSKKFGKLLEKLANPEYAGLKGKFLGIFEFFRDDVLYKIKAFLFPNADPIEGISTAYMKYSDRIKEVLGVLKGIFSDLAEFLFDSKKVSLNDILDTTQKIMSVLLLYKAIKVVDNITGSFQSIGDGFNNIAKSFKWRAIGDAFKAMAIALGAFAICLKVLETLDPETAWRNVGIMAGILIVMGGIVAGLTFLSSKMGTVDTYAAVISVLAFATSISILVGTLKTLDGTDFDHLGRSFAIMMGMLLGMAVSIGLVGKFAGKTSASSVASILTMIVALKMVLDVLEAYSKYDWGAVKSTIPKLVMVLLGLALVLRVATGSVKAGANIKGMALLMISIVIGLKVLLDVIEEMGKMNPDTMWQGIKGLLTVLGGITLMLSIINMTSKGGVLQKGQKSATAFAGLASALLAVVAAIYILGGMDNGRLYKGGAAVTAILSVFALMTYAFGKAGAGSFKFGSMLLMVIGMGVLIAALGFVIKELAEVGWGDAIGSAGALAGLLITISYVLKILAGTNPSYKNIAKWTLAMAGMTLIVAGLGAVLYQLKSVDGLNAAGQLAGISLTLVAMAKCLEVLTKHRNQPKTIVKWLAAMAGLTLIVAALARILYQLKDVNGLNAVAQMTALSIALLTMSGCISILSKVGALANMAYPAMAALAVFIVGLTVLLEIIGEIADAGFLSSIESGIKVMGQLGQAIGEFVGGIVGGVVAGIGKGISAMLPQLGKDLSDFMTNADAFIAGLNNVSMDTLAGAGILGSAIAAFLGVSVINSLTNLLTFGGHSLPIMGKDLGDFMTNAQPFIDGIKMVDADTANAAKALADTILALSTSTVLDGFAAIMGGDSFAEIGTELAALGGAIVEYAKTVSVLTPKDITQVAMSATAANAIVKVAKEIPNEGGLLGAIMGENDMAEFGRKISAFGKSLVSYAKSVSSLTEDDIAKIGTSADAAKALTTLANNIPNEGGWIAAIAGENDLATFGLKVSAFGKSLVQYAKSIAGLTTDDIARVRTSADAAKALTKVAENIPNEGGWIAAIAGENDLVSFGKKIAVFGKSLMTYASDVRGFTESDVTTIESTKDGVEALVEVANSIPNEGGLWGALAGDVNIENFGDGMVALAKGLTKYVKAASDLPDDAAITITKSKDAVAAMKVVAKELPSEGSVTAWAFKSGDTVGNFATNMASFATGVVSYAKKAADITEDHISAIKTSKDAVAAMKEVAKALPNNDESLGWMFTDLTRPITFFTNMSTFVDGIKSYVTKAKTIGEDSATVIDSSRQAIEAMTNAAKEVPIADGEVSWLFTGNTTGLYAFFNSMSFMADQIIAYANKANGMLNLDVIGIIDQSKYAIQAIVGAAEAIPGPEDGKVGWMFQENSLNTFGNTLNNLAVQLLGYLSKIQTIGEDDIESINNTKKALKAITESAAYLPQFYTEYGSTTSVAITQFHNLLDMLERMAGVDSAGIQNFATSLSSLGEIAIGSLVESITASIQNVTIATNNMMTALVNTISANTPLAMQSMVSLLDMIIAALNNSQVKFTQAGTLMMLCLITAFTEHQAVAVGALIIMMTACVSTVSGYYYSFYDAGCYVVDGFAAGITDSTFEAEAAAAAMADAAYDAAMEALDSNSPSKRFIKVGTYVPAGFAIGIDKLGDTVGDSAANMANKAIDNATYAVSRIGDVVTNGVDVEPSIRPVLDMSNLGSKDYKLTSSIDTLLTKPVDSLSQLISNAQSEINARNQEVINAVNGLREDLNLLFSSDGQEVALYVDSKKLATSIAKPMNHQLNILSKRGVY